MLRALYMISFLIGLMIRGYILYENVNKMRKSKEPKKPATPQDEEEHW